MELPNFYLARSYFKRPITKLRASRMPWYFYFYKEVKLSGFCSQKRSLNDLYSIFLLIDYCDKETLIMSRPTGVWLIRWYSSPHCPWSITNYRSGISFQELLVKKWLLAESRGKRSPLWHHCESFKNPVGRPIELLSQTNWYKFEQKNVCYYRMS